MSLAALEPNHKSIKNIENSKLFSPKRKRDVHSIFDPLLVFHATNYLTIKYFVINFADFFNLCLFFIGPFVMEISFLIN